MDIDIEQLAELADLMAEKGLAIVRTPDVEIHRDMPRHVFTPPPDTPSVEKLELQTEDQIARAKQEVIDTLLGSAGPERDMMETDNRRWQAAPKKEAHDLLCQKVTGIIEEQSARKQLNQLCLQAYGQRHEIGGQAVSHVFTPGRRLLSLNVIKSIVDTVVGDITQAQPYPTWDVTAGNWALQRAAKRRGQIVEGLFYQCGVDETTPDVFRDLCLFDFGAVKVYQPWEEEDDLVADRVVSPELHIDSQDALYGKPPRMYQTKWIDKDELVDVWAGRSQDRKEKIKAAGVGPAETGDVGYSDRADQAWVVEGWQLPRGGRDGRHIIACDSITLLDEPWTDKTFPFVFGRWRSMPYGFGGESLACQLLGVQYEINKILKEIQEAYHLIGKGYWLWPKGCGTPTAAINNKLGRVVEFNPGVGAPQFTAPAVLVPPEIYKQLERLEAWAYRNSGVSEMAAQSQKPAGLNSGKAILVFEDVQSKRFYRPGKVYEGIRMGVAKQLLKLAGRVYKKKSDYAVTWHGTRYGRGLVERIEFAKADIPEDASVMRCLPVSSLPRTPAGKTAVVETWINMGLVTDKPTIMRLLDFPDVEGETRSELASWNLINQMIDRMLFAEDPAAPGVYQSPEPQMDLMLAMRLTVSAYLQARLDGAPEDNLQHLRRFVAACKYELEKAAGPAGGVPLSPPGPGMPGAPPALPQGGDAPPMPEELLSMSEETTQTGDLIANPADGPDLPDEMIASIFKPDEPPPEIPPAEGEGDPPAEKPPEGDEPGKPPGEPPPEGDEPPPDEAAKAAEEAAAKAAEERKAFDAKAFAAIKRRERELFEKQQGVKQERDHLETERQAFQTERQAWQAERAKNAEREAEYRRNPRAALEAFGWDVERAAEYITNDGQVDGSSHEVRALREELKKRDEQIEQRLERERKERIEAEEQRAKQDAEKATAAEQAAIQRAKDGFVAQLKASTEHKLAAVYAARNGATLADAAWDYALDRLERYGEQVDFAKAAAYIEEKLEEELDEMQRAWQAKTSGDKDEAPPATPASKPPSQGDSAPAEQRTPKTLSNDSAGASTLPTSKDGWTEEDSRRADEAAMRILQRGTS